MKKLLSLLVLMALLTLAACGGGDTDSTSEQEGNTGAAEGSGKATEISILLGKPEIAKQFDAAIAEFSAENNVKVTVIPLAGSNAYERMTSLYASGNAPTIMMMGSEFDVFQENLLDLSNEPWMETVQEGMVDFVTVDDSVYGQPLTVEAFGFIYNKAVLDQAVGGDFDPATVRTHDQLKELLESLEALEGVDPIHVSPMDWSLGAHFTNPLFAAQSSDRDERHQFLQDIKDGNVSLADNDVFQGWLTTMDLMKEYNSAKNSPLAPQYDDGPLALAGGKVGLWFMGNWAYPQLAEIDPEGEYGFLPVPISNDASDYGNSEISVGVPSYWVVDAAQSTEAQQEAAKAFLNWLVASEEGQEHYVNGLNLIPVFDNFQVLPEDSLSLSVLGYMEGNNTLEWVNTYYPADGFPAMGASLQKYLSDNIDEAGLINEFESYWQSVKE
ncbi:ABC transporter substrate-binding protein [Halalkalibacter akibai]|uniref:Multiple sugar ABC transporter n=1 Tax=Halalkalibacter akibai (strain ATCC 43226 / DSM 21942 / CIP 109018 / JCM 9157 / 1139) TaxID=1236973 RepID=W4QYX9_HALA3|nr:ABC transporter substrate-binding protein [Halalkalibacter akibai]GAE37281.1 multiple sugar ABC transporter [Halalkalibacter akibai JCM 9157]